MTFEAPIWMQNNSYAARLDRMIVAQLWDEGVMDLTAFKVSQRSAGANFTVDVSLGEAVIQGDDQVNQGNYMARSIAVINATIAAAPASNSRYDIVCIRVNDPNAGGNAGNTASIVVTTGTASASPVVPTTPASSLLLAVIGPIATATSSITNLLIADSRILAGRRASPASIEWSANTAAPNGWLFAAGQDVSRTTYARLFAHISTTHGAGDGSTTFTLPDLRGRGSVGLDNMGGTDAGRLSVSNTLGGSGGTETVVLTKANLATHVHVIDHGHVATTGNETSGHTHPLSSFNVSTNTTGSHTHGAFLGGPASTTNLTAGAGIVGTTNDQTTTAGGDHTHTVSGTTSTNSSVHQHPVTVSDATGNTGNGSADGLAATAHANMQPYLLLNAFIRT